MHPFWTTVIAPLLHAAQARRIIEIGAEQGRTTALLLDRAARVGGVVEAIDPAPRFDVGRWELEHGARLRVHRGRSLDVLPGLAPADAVLVDGDHNWFTVRRELELLSEGAARAGVPLPLVVAHDVGWPYGRRDLYYDPSSIPVEHRHDCARSGILPGRSALGPDGLNASLWNATHEGGPRNGVRTAIEDFLAATPVPCELVVIEGLHGLAVLATVERLAATPELRDAVEQLRSGAFAHAWAAELERWRLGAELRARAAADTASSTLRTRLDASLGLLDGPDVP